MQDSALDTFNEEPTRYLFVSRCNRPPTPLYHSHNSSGTVISVKKSDSHFFSAFEGESSRYVKVGSTLYAQWLGHFRVTTRTVWKVTHQKISRTVVYHVPVLQPLRCNPQVSEGANILRTEVGISQRPLHICLVPEQHLLGVV